MTATSSRVRARKNKVFRSVFQVDLSQPTPALLSSEPGEGFGGPVIFPPSLSLDDTAHLSRGRQQQKSPYAPPPPPPHPLQPASDQVRWDRAWHAVTSRIFLPSSVAAEDSFGTLPPESQDLDASFYDSLPLVLDPQHRLPGATHTEDILQWHCHQARQHFVHHVMPLLAACAAQKGHDRVLLGSIQTLQAAHRQYLHGLSLIVRGYEDQATAAEAVTKISRDLFAILGSAWTSPLVTSLKSVLGDLLEQILCSSAPLGTSGRKISGEHQSPQSLQSHDELLSLVESLQKVGLAGERFQVLFAELIDQCMVTFIHKNYAGVWATFDTDSKTPASNSLLTGCMGDLGNWIENHYGRLAVEVLSRIGGQVAWADVERWKDVAVGRLATLRIHELFDIVLHWPDSRGGLEDLRSAVTTPQRRLQLTDTFSAVLQKRLLHPGRSTLHILQTYISMIRTFHALDHSKVLLDRVVHALQLYLCQRDDAIRVVVTGLLANPSSATPEDAKTKLVELAVILNETVQQRRRVAEDDDLDWNDMTWVPDPVDAGVNYKRPKHEDVIGTLISALGSEDIFIKEFQLIVAERLLSKQQSFTQETRVLGLLKKRFGENALQSCDVMLKDIQDSKRVDALLGKALHRGQAYPAYHSKILSRLFWPSLPNDSFTVPAPIAAVQEQYASGFEQLKSSRKLTWLDQLGTASVKLELEDRTVEVECKTYEAAVIYSFQDEGQGSSEPAKRTFNEIWEKLMIDEDLLTESLAFWVSKRVLRDVGDQTFVVLERLDTEQGAEGGEDADEDLNAPAGEASGAGSPRKTKVDPKELERRIVYWQFIVGMLTNSSAAMPLGQILMTLKMLIADGCPWSNEELQEFLGEKVAEGGLELVGGKYRLPKK
ncbi:cullin family protein [Sarocladium implicatum]|nr:cullin family protein [Sarocladium implicatum]